MVIQFSKSIRKKSQTDIPLIIGQPILWIDMADANSYVINNSNEVAVIKEKSPILHHIFTQIDPLNNPMTLTTLNGKTALCGNINNGFKSITFLLPHSEITMFIVLSSNNDYILDTTSNLYNVNTSGITIDGDTGIISALSDTESHILMIRWKFSTENIYAKSNDGMETVVATHTDRLTRNGGSVSLFVMNSEAGNEGSTGKLGELIIYPTFLLNDKINKLGNYLSNKWKLPWSNM